ncbi:hypothetical protein IAD21_00713 [Abditibacteriota bacterium]|nr:hypothetical protein IAD21_00713 [Abditibacteriota bacterium]
MKWFPCALLTFLLLGGCTASPPDVLDIGTTKESILSQRRTAIARLSQEIKRNPQTTLFLIRWVFDNKGHKSNSELAYNKNSGTLTLDELRYSNVTEQALSSVVSGGDVVEKLTKYGAVKTVR